MTNTAKDNHIKRSARLIIANRMIRTIATTGRGFCGHKIDGGGGYRISYFDLRKPSLNQKSFARLYYVDHYTQKPIYMHYEYWHNGFSEGGTLRDLVKRLGDFIWTGKLLHHSTFGEFPDWLCGGDPWGYGEAMTTVRKTAVNLGLIAVPTQDELTNLLEKSKGKKQDV